MERVKEAVRTRAGVIWRRGDTAGVESGIGRRRGRIDHGEGLMRGEAVRMPGGGDSGVVGEVVGWIYFIRLVLCRIVCTYG
jgi:hypothetical protein